MDRVMYGTGTVIARMAHSHERHDGPFEACVRCHGFGTWEPDRDFGIVICAGDGRLVEASQVVWRLLVS